MEMELIRLQDFAFHVANLLILFLFLRHFLYKPVTKFLNERQQRIETEHEEIQHAQQEMKDKAAHYDRLIADARDESARIVQQSNALARERAKEIEALAHEEAEEVIARAQREAQFNRAHAKEALRAEIADMSIDIASKVILREINPEDNKAIIEDFFEKVG